MRTLPRWPSPQPLSSRILFVAVVLLTVGSALLLLSFVAAALPSLRAFGPALRWPVPWLLAVGLLLLVAYAAVKPSVDSPLRERDTPLFGNSTDFVPRSDDRADGLPPLGPVGNDSRDRR